MSFFLQRTSWLYHLAVCFEVGLKTVGRTYSREKETLVSKPHVKDYRILCTFATSREQFLQVVPRVGCKKQIPSASRESLLGGMQSSHSLGSESELSCMPFLTLHDSVCVLVLVPN